MIVIRRARQSRYLIGDASASDQAEDDAGSDDEAEDEAIGRVPMRGPASGDGALVEVEQEVEGQELEN